MNAALLIPLFIIALWAILSLAVLAVDWREGRRHREHLQTRAWQEKVDAMRRLQDQEGEA
jgi:hypothetical protein